MTDPRIGRLTPLAYRGAVTGTSVNGALDLGRFAAGIYEITTTQKVWLRISGTDGAAAIEAGVGCIPIGHIADTMTGIEIELLTPRVLSFLLDSAMVSQSEITVAELDDGRHGGC